MNSETSKRPLISAPFLIVAILILVGGYFGGPWILTQVFRVQEAMKAKSGAVAHGVPEGKPVLGGFDSNPSEQGDQSGGDGEERGQGRRGGDPEQFFASRDADGNGKLEGDEIPERMQERIASIDSDADGAISKEEFIDAMAQMRARRGGRPPSESGGEDNSAEDNAVAPDARDADAARDSTPSETNQEGGNEAATQQATDPAQNESNGN